MRGKVVARQPVGVPDADCGSCHFYAGDMPAAKLRREVRKHVAATGHSVWIEWNASTRYDYVPDEEQAR